jgi:CD63 antigen
MVSGGMKCIKYLLFIFNLIFFIAGLLLVIAGTVMQTAFNKQFAFFSGSSVNQVAIFIIIVGFIIFTVGFFGCCGAHKENHCMVVTFAVLLGFVFILEIAAAIAAQVLRPKLDDAVRSTMTATIQQYPQGEFVLKTWDDVQTDLQCCGANNYTDWQSNAQLNDSVPDSCCINYQPGCGLNVFKSGNLSTIFSIGCADEFLNASQKTILICIGVAIGVALIEILGVIIACFLAASIKKEYQPV